MTEQVLRELFQESFDSDLVHADILVESTSDEKYAKQWDEEKHPRVGKGSPEGGQFGTGGGGAKRDGPGVHTGRQPVGATERIKQYDSLPDGTVQVDEKAIWRYTFRQEFSSEKPGATVRPEEVDGEHERKAMKAALDASREFWSDRSRDAQFIRAQDNDPREPINAANIRVGMMTVYTLSTESAGAGSGGPGGAKVFWTPYSVPNRRERLTTENGYTGYADHFGVDPMYVLAHELHHAWGSNSEFDLGSEVVGVLAHLKSGLNHNPKAAVDQVQGWACSVGFSKTKTRRRRYSRLLRYLDNKDSTGLRKLMTQSPFYRDGTPAYKDEEWTQIMEIAQQNARSR